MSGRGQWRWALSLVLVAPLVGCGGSGSGEIESQTPRVKSGDASLEPGLVTRKDLASVRGLPELRRVSGSDAPVFENPDPRGPCGARIRQPDLSAGATAVLVAPAMTVANIVIRLGEARADAFLAASLADAQPDCPPFVSRTNTGAIQRVTPELVDLPPVGDQRIGAVAKIVTRELTGYAGSVLIRRGPIVVMGLIVAANPILPETLRDFGETIDIAAARIG